jgi:8-oxo-dGTP diphosphatase
VTPSLKVKVLHVQASVNLTQVAVGIVHNAQGQVLFAQRPAGKPYAGWWEFPGGKIESGETLALALARELREELGIQILDCHHWLTQRFVYPHAHVNLQFCHVRHFSGSPQSLEGQAFTWGSPEQPPFPFLPAALPVLKAMQIPAILRLTAATQLGFETWKCTLNALQAGVLVVHEPEADESLAWAVLQACLAWRDQQAQCRTVIVSSVHPSPWWGMADGVHLSEQALQSLQHRPSYQWLGATVSTEIAMLKAQQMGCNYLCVDPSKGKTSQPASASIGWGALGEWLHDCQVASYVMGDLTLHHLPLAQAAGAAGLALRMTA